MPWTPINDSDIQWDESFKTVLDRRYYGRFYRALQMLQLEIQNNLKRTGKWNSGRSWQSLKPKVVLDNNGTRLTLSLSTDQPEAVWAWEHGLRPGVRVPLAPLVTWCRLRGFRDPRRAAWGVKTNLFKRGSRQWQQGDTEDIYTTSQLHYRNLFAKGVQSMIKNCARIMTEKILKYDR